MIDLDLSALLTFKGNNNDRVDRRDKRDRDDNKNNSRRDRNRNKNDRNPFSINDDLDALRMHNNNGNRKNDKNNDKNSHNNKKQVEGSAKKSKHAFQLALLEDFVKEYLENKTDTVQVLRLIQEQLPDVSHIVAINYDSTKNSEEMVEAMNKVIYLLTTKLFATALLTSFKDELIDLNEVKEEGQDVKADIATLISIALDTSSNKMVDATISIYVEIVSEIIWPAEIKEMVSTLGISEDAAIDTVIAIPRFGKRYNEKQLRMYTPKFFGVIGQHAETMIDVMNVENFVKYFYYIFPDLDDNGQGLKAIGKCLAFELVTVNGEKEKALYENYINALYQMLDDYDICDIQTVIKYIVNELSKRENLCQDAPLIFNMEKASGYNNIGKALADLCTQDANVKRLLSKC